ncbi:MAG: hypothetical protein AAB662_00220 [Patescibacteria group bacterium]
MANLENKSFDVVGVNDRVIGLKINPEEWTYKGIRDVLYYRLLFAERTRIEIETKEAVIKTWKPEFLVEERSKGIKEFLDENTKLVKNARLVTIYDEPIVKKEKPTDNMTLSTLVKDFIQGLELDSL